MKGNQR